MSWPEHVPARLAGRGRSGPHPYRYRSERGCPSAVTGSTVRKMLRHAHRHGRSLTVLGTGLVAGAVLVGCATDPTRTAPAAATSSASSPTPTASNDLAAGLLPADAFGEGADVETLPFDGVAGLDHWGHGGPWGHDDGSVTP